MAGVRSGATWGQIQRLFGLGTVSGLTDWQLLERFAARRDEAAFGAIVAAHAPMVLAVCRRVLRDPDDVEDAFQATFLVLIRKAGVLRPQGALGHWLYGVALRVAIRARTDSTRRRTRERSLAETEVRDGCRDPGVEFDLGPLLDEELKRLPAGFRAAVVLCDLEGLSHVEAARQLGWPLGTVKGRLSRARRLLRERLTRRGLAMTSGGLTALLSRESEASVPTAWGETVVKAAARVAAGEATSGLIRTSAVALAEGVIWVMLTNQWKAAVAALTILAALTAGVGALAQKGGPDRPADAPNLASRSGPKDDTSASKEKLDPSLAPIAEKGYESTLALFRGGERKADDVYLWSRRIADLETDPSDPASRKKAARGHRERMDVLVAAAESLLSTNRIDSLERLNTQYYKADADRLLKDAEAGSGPAVTVKSPDGMTLTADRIDVLGSGTVTIRQPDAGTGQRPSVGKDARSQAILKTLEEPLIMSFANETPLEDLLKHIRTSTKSSAFPKGLPIYVDPIGLQDAEKTLTSPITIDLEGVPLRRTLHLALRQLGLCFWVEDGMIYIDAMDSDEAGSLAPAVKAPSPFMVLQDRFDRGEMNAQERKEFIELLKDRKLVEEMERSRGSGGGGSFQ